MSREFSEARRSDLGQLLSDGARSAPFAKYRKLAFESFEKYGLPDRRNEHWKYTSLDALGSVATPSTAETVASIPQGTVLDSLDAYRLTLRNGKYDSDELDALKLVDGNMQILGLAEASINDPALLDRYLANMQDPALSPYNLNTALLDDAIIIRVAAGHACNKPLLLTFACDEANRKQAAYPRIIVQLEKGASMTLVEIHSDQTDLVTQVNQFDLADESRLMHYSLQHDAPKVTHLSRTEVHVAANAEYFHHGMQFGGQMLRNEIDVDLAAPGAAAELSGLFLPTGKQHMDNHICVTHSAPETRSMQNYRGVMNDQGRGVFNGKVVVREAAQKTDAKQSNRNLLLSNRAEIDTKPELEIYADDVKCSHGVTTGQLDKNQLFYLLSRGIEAETAQSLLVFAFADSVISSVDIPEIREHLEQHLVGELPNAERIRDFV